MCPKCQDIGHKAKFCHRRQSQPELWPCENCGEYNHDTRDCYFDEPIECPICHQFGHKGKFCDVLSEDSFY